MDFLYFTDAVGQRVEPGDVIAYMVRYGSSMNYKFGKVVKIYEKTKRYHSEPCLYVQIIGMNTNWKGEFKKFYKASLTVPQYIIKLHYWNDENIKKLASQQI